MSDFFHTGMKVPSSNYFRMPNEWTDITYNITSLAELKVVEYILRHTWGFQEFHPDSHPKRITVDEFINGRRRKDGSRLDKGTGLSEEGVRTGLKLAESHGLIEVFVDDSDKGRTKKEFRLRMEPTPSNAYGNNDPGPQTLGGDPQTFDPYPQNFRGRTEKDTTERNLEKEKSRGSDSSPLNGSKEKQTNGKHQKNQTVATGDKGFAVLGKDTPPSPTEVFAVNATKRLYEAIAVNGKLMGRSPNMNKWRYSMLLFVEKHWEERDRIKRVLTWYCEHLGDNNDFIPKAYSVDTFKEKFIKIEDAMKSNGYTKTKQEIEDDRLMEESNQYEMEKAKRAKMPVRTMTAEEEERWAEECGL